MTDPTLDFRERRIGERSAGSPPPVSQGIGFERWVQQTMTLNVVQAPGEAVPPRPIRMLIFTVPPRVSRVDITHLGIAGAPRSWFHNFISWTIQTQHGNIQEAFFTSSPNGGTATTYNDAGIRWCGVGSLARPVEFPIRLNPTERLFFAITAHETVNALIDVRLTAYAHVRGQLYFGA